MATFVKFQDFVHQLGLGIHNLNTHTFKVYLTNADPDAAADAVKTDLAEIAGGNGYTAGGADIQNAYSEAAGTGTMTAVDVTFTASGGSIGPFRYAVLYNDDATSDNLMGYYDRGESITLADGDTFTVDFGASLLTLT